ncbi:MAG: GNAT family N-acetyltransferase [Lachnospiraceae bacterium]|nr:GNAT family N-acetyltransferase [Lachnospiraceae bacterium]
MALAWRTFLRFEADVYTPEGVKNFENFITDSTLHRMFVLGTYQLFVALDGNKVVGMITLRDTKHISLLFVDEAYHRRGIGRALINHLTDYLITEMGISRVTVNASPYGVGFYHKMGFCDLGPEEIRDGIIYTPMEFIL